MAAIDARFEPDAIFMAAHPHLPFRSLGLTQLATTGALVLFTIAVLSEAARTLGVIDMNTQLIRVFFVLITVLAAGVAVVEHYVAKTRELEHMNTELERRVAEKAREIERDHARLDEAKRERALICERQRILADIHDGMGASLVGLLRYVQSGKTDSKELEHRVRTALQEMRIAIDALEPAEGDLAAVLGTLRYRLEPLMASTGVRFAWDVAELPCVEALDSSAVFAIQRIVLEAIANALKHSNARQIRLTLRALNAESVEIRIEDDGGGFDVGRPAAGLGLSNMRARAQRLGAQVSFLSQSGRGTTVSLTLPRRLEAAHAGSAADATFRRTSPVPLTPV
jgi:signal transduction histidine kinase